MQQTRCLVVAGGGGEGALLCACAVQLNDSKNEEEITESQDTIEDINDDRLLTFEGDGTKDSCAWDQLSGTSSFKHIDK